jgi:hypothetical protein
MGHFPRLGTYADSISCTGCSQAAPLHPLEFQSTHDNNHLSPMLSIATGSARAVPKRRSKNFRLSRGHMILRHYPTRVVSIVSIFLILGNSRKLRPKPLPFAGKLHDSSGTFEQWSVRRAQAFRGKHSCSRCVLSAVFSPGLYARVLKLLISRSGPRGVALWTVALDPLP